MFKWLKSIKSYEYLKRLYLLFLNRKNKESTYYKWLKADGDRSLRINYNLNENSVLFDLGGFEGRWANDMHLKYRCTVYIFEPVPEFAEKIKQRFITDSNIFVYPYALAEKNGETQLGLANDSSSIFRQSQKAINIKLVEAEQFFNEKNILKIDVMKINIEGAEYNLLEHMIEKGLVDRIQNIQVQFHNIFPYAAQRMEAIQKKLSATHQLAYQFPFVWENWKKSSNTYV